MKTLNAAEYARMVEDKAASKEDTVFKMAKWQGERGQPYLFVPMATVGRMGETGKDGKGKLVHTMDVITRGKFISNVMDDSWKFGGLGTSYRAYFWGVIFFALTVVSYLYIHVYLAAVFAYLTGFMRSQYLMNHAWNVEWFKNKSVIHTK